MLNTLRMRILHGNPAIRNIRTQTISDPYKSFPEIDSSRCIAGCGGCADVCPVGAIRCEPLRIDLGTCVLCGDCERLCGNNAIRFVSRVRTYASGRDSLVVTDKMRFEDYTAKAMEATGNRFRMFRRSLKLRQVSAGGCNGCELELGACSNVNFDMARFGIEFVASPKHADGIVITGPVTANMAKALSDAFESVPHPKIVVACGTCAISGGLFAGSEDIDRRFFDEHEPDLYLPGCPPHPLTIINGLFDLIH